MPKKITLPATVVNRYNAAVNLPPRQSYWFDTESKGYVRVQEVRVTVLLDSPYSDALREVDLETFRERYENDNTVEVTQ